MKLVIETARNGFLIRDQEEVEPIAVANGNPVDATFELLGWVLELIGYVGSRYDKRRVRIVIEPGDKYMSQDEWNKEMNLIADKELNLIADPGNGD